MKQSIKVLFFGVLYATLALLLPDTLGLIYATFSGITAILHVLLDIEENRERKLYHF